MPEYIGYHGTNNEAAKKIIEQQGVIYGVIFEISEIGNFINNKIN